MLLCTIVTRCNLTRLAAVVSIAAVGYVALYAITALTNEPSADDISSSCSSSYADESQDIVGDSIFVRKGGH